MQDVSIRESEAAFEPPVPASDQVERQPASIAACRDRAWLPASELFERIGEITGEDGPLVVDLSGLDHLEAASLQVLIATHLDWAREGRDLVLVNVSESLRRWFSLSGADFILKMS